MQPKTVPFLCKIFLMEVGVFKILKFKLTIQLIIKFYNVKKIWIIYPVDIQCILYSLKRMYVDNTRIRNDI